MATQVSIMKYLNQDVSVCTKLSTVKCSQATLSILTLTAYGLICVSSDKMISSKNGGIAGQTLIDVNLGVLGTSIIL